MIPVGVVIGIAMAAFGVGFMVCSWFAIGRDDDLACALWQLIQEPENEQARDNAWRLLTGK